MSASLSFLAPSTSNKLPALLLKETKEYGKGVFANEFITAGTLVITFSGPVVTAEEIVDDNYSLQISHTQFLTPSGELDDYINHSCSPNCGLILRAQTLHLYAIADIKQNQQITFDYSTSTNLGDDWTMECCCGETNCRKVIGDFNDLPKNLQEYYLALGVVPEFVASGPEET